MSLRYGLTLSMFLHICLFSAIFTVFGREGDKGLSEKTLFARLVEDIDTAPPEPQRSNITKTRQIVYSHEVLPVAHGGKDVIEDVRTDNNVLNPNSEGLNQAAGSSLSGDDNELNIPISTQSGGYAIDSEVKGQKPSLISSHSVGEDITVASTPLNTIKDLIEKTKRYPTLARKRGIEGTVHVGFRIDKDGRPYDIKVINSSGFSILDRAGIEMIKRAAPFPYIDKPIELSISFRLDKE